MATGSKQSWSMKEAVWRYQQHRGQHSGLQKPLFYQHTSQTTGKIMDPFHPAQRSLSYCLCKKNWNKEQHSFKFISWKAQGKITGNQKLTAFPFSPPSGKKKKSRSILWTQICLFLIQIHHHWTLYVFLWIYKNRKTMRQKM